VAQRAGVAPGIGLREPLAVGPDVVAVAHPRTVVLRVGGLAVVLEALVVLLARLVETVGPLAERLA
jgi:hypothetical protein